MYQFAFRAWIDISILKLSPVEQPIAREGCIVRKAPQEIRKFEGKSLSRRASTRGSRRHAFGDVALPPRPFTRSSIFD